jgi:hypothetical protein
MEFHVRKVRETETGGQPTSFDEPIYFEITPDHTGFYGQIGGQLYRGLFDKQPETEYVFDLKEITV